MESLGASNQNQEHAKKIVLTNRIAIISFFLATPYLLFFYLFGFKFAAFMVIPTNVLCGIVLLCNYFRLHRLASLLVCNGITLVILFYSLHLGFNSGAYLIFFPLMAWPFILFRDEHYISKWFSLIFLVLSLVTVHALRIFFYSTDIRLIDYSAGKFIYFFASITTALFTSFTLFLFYKSESNALKDLSEKNHFLNQKNSELLCAYRELKDKKRLDQEYESAKKMQAQFLPVHMPQISGYHIEHFYRGSRGVSGDFFDYRCFAKKAKFFVADVVSKSISAAFITVHLYSIFRTFVTQTTTPSQLLSQINTIFYGGRNHYEKAASFAFELNTDLDTITYAHAGLGLVMFISDGNFSELQPTGFMSGSDKDGTYDEVTLELKSGDIFLVASDGLEDVQNKQGERFGHQRVKACIQDYLQLQDVESGAVSLKQYIVNQINIFEEEDSLSPDDIVLIVIKKM